MELGNLGLPWIPVRCLGILSVLMVMLSHCSMVNPQETAHRTLLANHSAHGNLWLYNTLETWEGAQAACRSKGADLVSITDPELQGLVMDGMKDITNDFLGHPWIGAKRVDVHGWKWLGLALDENVQVTAARYFCAYMTWYGDNNFGYRADTMCDEKKRYICGMSMCHGSPGCYHISAEDDKLSFDEAASKCKSIGKTLVTFQASHDEMGDSKGIDMTKASLGDMGVDDYWIGLQYVGWDWVTGNAMTFTHEYFTIEESQKKLESGCIELWPSGHWMSTDCTKEAMYICQTTGDAGFYEFLNYLSTSEGQKVIIIAIVLLVVIIFIIACAIKCVRDRKERKRDYEVSYKPAKNGTSKCSIEEV